MGGGHSAKKLIDQAGIVGVFDGFGTLFDKKKNKEARGTKRFSERIVSTRGKRAPVVSDRAFACISSNTIEFTMLLSSVP